MSTKKQNDDFEEQKQLLEKAYRYFNARDIDGVLKLLDSDVDWPNGMEGGIEHGHDAVRKYWTRQWAMINPRVEPEHFQKNEDGGIDVSVHQVVKDLSGKLMHDQTVHHIYSFKDGLIAAMQILNP